MSDALLHFLGLARRAGKLSLGSDPAQESLRKGRARLVLLASDLSPRTAGGVELAAKEKGVAVVKIGATMDEISTALGKRTGVVAVNDPGFAKKLIALCADERGGI
ncbi:L7Ae/L30e/S12e/Gadd45 family ribosomal protein [Caproiciproducens sp. LBM24188]